MHGETLKCDQFKWNFTRWPRQ